MRHRSSLPLYRSPQRPCVDTGKEHVCSDDEMLSTLERICSPSESAHVRCTESPPSGLECSGDLQFRSCNHLFNVSVGTINHKLEPSSALEIVPHLSDAGKQDRRYG